MRKRGFTLVELLVVIVVLAILAAIALPSYQRYVDRSNRQSTQQFMYDVLSRAEEFRLDRRVYPANIGALTIDIPERVSRYFEVTAVGTNTVTPPTFVVTATPVNPRLPTMTLNHNRITTCVHADAATQCPAGEW
jgi:type IV pilus assembly protein PilE